MKQSLTPAISLTETGCLVINKQAIKDFKLEKVAYVSLHYDRGTRLLLIQPQEKKFPGVLELKRQVTGQVTVGIKRFLIAHNAIIPHTTRRYEQDPESGVMKLVIVP